MMFEKATEMLNRLRGMSDDLDERASVEEIDDGPKTDDVGETGGPEEKEEE